MSSLKGRIAVVTGAGAGIGQTTAATLAARGADVAVADVGSTDETRALVEGQGRRFLGLKCDVSSEEEVAGFAEQVRRDLGPVDIVVNNAGMAYHAPFDNDPKERWQRLLAINVHGYFFVTKAFLADLKQSTAGRVINMTSTSYLEANLDTFVAYVTSKGAINGFTNSLACELAKFDITVNAVAPSIVRTPLTEGQLTEQIFEKHIQLQSLKRQQQPSDVANMIAYLASDEANFITGQILCVDGGLTRR